MNTMLPSPHITSSEPSPSISYMEKIFSPAPLTIGSRCLSSLAAVNVSSFHSVAVASVETIGFPGVLYDPLPGHDNIPVLPFGGMHRSEECDIAVVRCDVTTIDLRKLFFHSNLPLWSYTKSTVPCFILSAYNNFFIPIVIQVINRNTIVDRQCVLKTHFITANRCSELSIPFIQPH